MASEAPTTTTGGSGERRLTAEYVAARVLLDATSIEEAASRMWIGARLRPTATLDRLQPRMTSEAAGT